jgi:hypothetical protein
MNCPRNPQVYSFASGESLPASDHFASCPSCAALLARLDGIKAGLAARGAVDAVDREIAERAVERALAGSAPVAARPPARFSYALAAAFLLGAFAAGLLLLPPLDRPAPPVEPADIGLARSFTPARTLYIGWDEAWTAAWWADEEWKTLRISDTKLHRGQAPVGAAGAAALASAGAHTGWFFDPTGRRSVEIPPSPRTGSSRILDAVTAEFVGRRLVVWGVADAPPHGAVLDLASMKWTEAPEAPIEPRYRALSASTGDRLIVWGGYSGMPRVGATVRNVEAGPLSDGAMFDPAAGRWIQLPAAPRPFAYGMAAAGGRDSFAVYDPQARTALILSLPGLKWSQAASGPEAGPFPACVLAGRELFVWNGTGGVLDLSKGEWRKLPKAPIAGRALAFARVEGSRVRVWGGWSESEEFQRDAAEFDLGSWTWRKLPDAPVGVPSELHPGW